ncbi:hypothetical protein ACFQGE_11500 [Halomicroarcula sp. GCM10025817]|uniref:hypothetical protein n=1 Tax=Haloarcula TaxID=2237 RepID=UPI0023E85FAD|nr:hypothetical protein [Halomicroarcula sp. SYNS111]
MPSDTADDAALRSVRRWLCVVAFALGVGLVALANIGNVVTGYQDGLLFALTGVAGGVVALAAAVTLIDDLLPESSAPDPDGHPTAGSDDTRTE